MSCWNSQEIVMLLASDSHYFCNGFWTRMNNKMQWLPITWFGLVSGFCKQSTNCLQSYTCRDEYDSKWLKHSICHPLLIPPYPLCQMPDPAHHNFYSHKFWWFLSGNWLWLLHFAQDTPHNAHRVMQPHVRASATPTSVTRSYCLASHNHVIWHVPCALMCVVCTCWCSNWALPTACSILQVDICCVVQMHSACYHCLLTHICLPYLISTHPNMLA